MRIIITIFFIEKIWWYWWVKPNQLFNSNFQFRTFFFFTRADDVWEINKRFSLSFYILCRKSRLWFKVAKSRVCRLQQQNGSSSQQYNSIWWKPICQTFWDTAGKEWFRGLVQKLLLRYVCSVRTYFFAHYKWCNYGK